MDAWYEHCRKRSEEMTNSAGEVASRTASGWAFVGGELFHAETRSIYGYLCDITCAGLFTTSSQPTGPGVHLHQRAYVAGYLPAALLELMRPELPADLSACPAPGEILVARDDGAGGVGNYNWGGSMAEETLTAFGLNGFEQLQLRPCEIVDISWTRTDSYLFVLVLSALQKQIRTVNKRS